MEANLKFFGGFWSVKVEQPPQARGCEATHKVFYPPHPARRKLKKSASVAVESGAVIKKSDHLKCCLSFCPPAKIRSRSDCSRYRDRQEIAVTNLLCVKIGLYVL
ncbi:hypothetical protein EVAR_70470_1 [Eumeta japonica]|uniref:Uncharacterized protein n=1 Tax=Eumeta variegata TaxID=151549 RepID=A0A4C2AA31_EUMVA|nr:hypothetical protein EVAR_70470_1 [Eumeta japonica]